MLWGDFPPTHNSAICTEGGTFFELLRNPDIKVESQALQVRRQRAFHQTVKAQFDKNELVKWLYPEYYVNSPKSQERWSSQEIVPSE